MQKWIDSELCQPETYPLSHSPYSHEPRIVSRPSLLQPFLLGSTGTAVGALRIACKFAIANI